MLFKIRSVNQLHRFSGNRRLGGEGKKCVALELQARSRRRGRGARAPPEIFRLELNSATKVEFFY